jgi:low affinity Fe/Cu permease
MEDASSPDPGRDERHVASDLRGSPRPYTRLAQKVTIWSGSPGAVVVSVFALLAWIAVGTVTRFPRWWEISLTVGLSFLTLLMLILIQHTQNHDDQAVQLKLDELIRASDNASNQMMMIEESSQSDMNRIRQAFGDEAAT